jgi:hypothetical protein
LLCWCFSQASINQSPSTDFLPVQQQETMMMMMMLQQQYAICFFFCK